MLGSNPPAEVVINEFTTLASAVTTAQFLDATAIKGQPLALRIAAGNVPNFVDLQAGGYGATIQDALNSAQTPTMANFATLAEPPRDCRRPFVSYAAMGTSSSTSQMKKS